LSRGKWEAWGGGKVMKHRLIQALLLGVPAAATFSTGVSIVQAAEECRLKPDSTAPSGSRWVYRINRADHRHCWYLSSKAGITHSHLAHRYRHLAGDPEAARQDQQGGDSDLQTAFAPSDKTDVAVAAKLPPMPQAATPSTEHPPDDLIPRSVSTVVYRLPTASAKTVTEPTAPALPVRTVTPAATSKSNAVLLAGAAAAALCFAGGVFHFTRRVHRSVRLDSVADGHDVRVSVGDRSLVDTITSDLVEGVEQGLCNLKRDQQRNYVNLPLSDETHDEPTVFLPHAAGWLSQPKAKSRTPANYQLADA
jgi:hypothetical protein